MSFPVPAITPDDIVSHLKTANVVHLDEVTRIHGRRTFTLVFKSQGAATMENIYGRSQIYKKNCFFQKIQPIRNQYL